MELGREDNLLSNTYESGNMIAKIYFLQSLLIGSIGGFIGVVVSKILI